MIRATTRTRAAHGRRVAARAGGITFREEEVIPAKASGIRQNRDDVFIFRYCAAGGYGDPLMRDPELVAADVARGMVSAGEAERLYGVVHGETGGLDRAATAERRTRVREGRRSWSGPATTRKAEGSSDGWTIGPDLLVTSENGELLLSCLDCGTILSPLTGNWKDGALVGEIPVQDGNILCPPPETLIDDEFVIRQYACPGCARLLDSEVRRKSEPPFWDLRIEGLV